MKLLPLTMGKFAMVDDDDFEWLRHFKWCVCKPKKDSNIFYAGRRINGNVVRLHSVIMNTPKGMMVDHINHDGLDCRKSNLRIATPSQNAMNKRNISGAYLHRRKSGNYWSSYIQVNYQNIYLGFYKSRDEAVSAYRDARIKYFGEFA